jgi:ribosomal protein S18 acetylase RimI-like enzyme
VNDSDRGDLVIEGLGPWPARGRGDEGTGRGPEPNCNYRDGLDSMARLSNWSEGVTDPAIADIEDAFEAHWRHFGLYPGARLVDEHGVLRFESPLACLPYNAVIRTRIPPSHDAAPVAVEIDARYRARAVPYMWVLRPSDMPNDIAGVLSRLGLDLVEVVTGMDIDLLTRTHPQHDPPAGIDIRQVEDEAGLADYEELIRTYWSIPDSDRDRVRTLNRHWTGERSFGIRLVAYAGAKPIAKLFLSLGEMPRRASVYGVAVLPEARGKGLATAMMARAMALAKEQGARKMVLHASQMAQNLYRRMNFAERCRLLVYATGPIFGTHHH